jgi:site-specific recombinase XerD
MLKKIQRLYENEQIMALDILEQYLAFKTDETKRQYRGVFKEFVNFSNDAVSKITVFHVSKFIAEQQKKYGQKDRLTQEYGLLLNSTIHRKLIILSAIWRYFIASDIAKKNPFDKFIVKGQRSPKKRPTELIPFDLVKKILSLPGNDKEGVRDLALLSVLFGLGLRRREVANLRLGNIHKSPTGESLVRLTQKGGFTIEKPLPDWVSKALSALVAQRQAEGAENKDYLFLTYIKKFEPKSKLSESSIYRSFKRYCAMAGLDYHTVSPHCARATAITKLLVDGVDYEDVRQFAGHSRLTTTQKYDKRKSNSSCGTKLDY